MHQHYIFKLIEKERKRQDLLHPNQEGKSDYEMCPILIEEVGEVCKAILEGTNLEEELIHVASVCVRWLEMKER